MIGFAPIDNSWPLATMILGLISRGLGHSYQPNGGYQTVE